MPYIKIPLDDVIEIEQIISVYDFSFDKDYVYEGESHDFWEFIYIDSGRAAVSSGDKTYNMSAGSLLFHRPGRFHSVRCNGAMGARAVIVAFDSHSAAMDIFGDDTMELAAESRRYINQILKDAEQCFEVGSMPLTARPDAPLGARQLLRSDLESFIIRLMRALEKSRAQKRLFFTSREELERCLVDDIIAYLRDKINERISLDELCAHFHFCKSHICHIFKERTGRSIVGCFLDMKIERAKQLLLSGEMNINEISEQLSFESSQYFSKTFKRLSGASPSEFKRGVRSF